MIKDFLINTLLMGVIDCSYWICLFVCMLSFIFYIVGCKKSGRIASISFIVYILTQAMKGVVK